MRFHLSFSAALFSRTLRGILYLFFISNLSFTYGSENTAYYEDMFRLANEYYSKGNYDSSVYYYESIVNAEYESAALYYNLGNAYYKKKNIPSAILYYEKGKKLKPDDSDILFNLQLANQQITDKIEPLPEFFLSKWWNGIISSASADAWGKWTLILAFYAGLMMVFFIFSDSVLFRKLFFWSGIAGIILAGFTFSFAMEQEKFLTESNEAIVFSASITTKSSPDEGSTNLFVIHEGTKVKILENVNGWCKISLADGNIGWIKTDHIRII